MLTNQNESKKSHREPRRHAAKFPDIDLLGERVGSGQRTSASCCLVLIFDYVIQTILCLNAVVFGCSIAILLRAALVVC